ncbi:putative F-box/LRR-repeat protein [Cardamine amara subsp. amara]|uniref:F-box/LRR-repeat protein n=1 Tax=Cardamine amara subsp. amara TaxID=228776 RepID=A0ABD1BMS5_CARAN
MIWVSRVREWEGFIEHVMVGDATDLIMGIHNVQILYLSGSTIEVLTFCCKAIPMFNNLTHLTIESNTKFGWDSLLILLKKCPNLKTLIF